ncbi:UNVERIFIED_CONTAM: hypothetical protein HDU68_002021 [Siphonaria sp. JEL0065]|nr:hypothetical protein HDU68_002021 [Siphonaria sp. JEL0065]
MMDYINRVQGEGIGQDLWMRWAKQLASAVDYVHSFGFVHHDVKPHNCLLTANNDVKLADFGNALQVNGFQPSLITSAPSTPNDLYPKDYHIYATATPSNKEAERELTQSPQASPTSKPTPFSRDQSGDSLLPYPIPSLPPSSTSCLSPSARSFVDRFKSELSDASSIRTSRTGSLTDGLGRGTQAYMAPEMFTSSPTAEYSFPVDVYAVGVTLFVAVTGVQPFSGGPGGGGGSSVYMMMGIKRGFWMSGLQSGFGVYGPNVSSNSESGEAIGHGVEMRRSLCQGGGGSGGGGIKANRWLQEGDSVAGGDGVVKFSGSGRRLDVEAVRIMCACLEIDGGVRPTARELVVWLNTLY